MATLALMVMVAGCNAASEKEAPGSLVGEVAFAHVFVNPTEDLKRAVQLVPSNSLPGIWYLVRQNGSVLLFSEDPAEPGYLVALDIADERIDLSTDESGLMSMALHPSGDFAFLVYTAVTNSHSGPFDSRLSRFDVLDDGTLDAESEVVFLDIEQPKASHSGSHVVFGEDGLLYYSVGDGGCCGDPFDQAQDTTTLSGALLRLNVDSPDFDRGSVYSIPVDNPFVRGGGAPEIFAFGLRNAWRFSFDRLEGSLWLGDVGGSRREEINRIAAGLNYGWSIIEGTRCSKGEGCDRSGLIEPIVDYGHSLGAAVTGGFVYRGDELDNYQGRYFFADFVSGLVMSFDAESEAQPEIRSEWDSSHFIVSFAESPQGELYLVGFSRRYEGQLFKLVRRPSAAETPPALLSETGLFDPLDLTRGRSGSIAFKPQAALWSDGANKERFMILPEDGQIAVAESGHLDLPLETALVKHFDYDDEIHETRIFRRSAEGWVGASYRWKDDRSDAELLLDGLETSIGGGRLWSYPSTSQCKQCHTSAAGRSLGLTASQIDFPFDAGIGDGVRNQLERLHDAGRFEETIDLIKVQEFVDLSDPLGAGDLARRARSYLQANCAHCHQPAGPTPSRIDLRFSTETSQMGICDIEPQRGDLGIADPQLRILSPGRPDLSVLLLRMDRRDSFQMPPLGTNLIDEEAVQMLGSWIESIEDCDD